MYLNITTFIKTIHTLPNEILEEVMSHFQHLAYPKNHLLLKQGRPCEYLWFMQTGAVRFFLTMKKGRRAMFGFHWIKKL